MSLTNSEPYVNGSLISGDLKRIKVDTLRTTDECAQVMTSLDEIIGNIQDQLDQAAMHFNETGEASDSVWVLAARRALKGAKTTRAAVQERRGALSRAAKQRNTLRWECKFVNAARILLDAPTFKKIMDLAHVGEGEPE